MLAPPRALCLRLLPLLAVPVPLLPPLRLWGQGGSRDAGRAACCAGIRRMLAIDRRRCHAATAATATGALSPLGTARDRLPPPADTAAAAIL
jgi:hypothetical protein